MYNVRISQKTNTFVFVLIIYSYVYYLFSKYSVFWLIQILYFVLS